jgi:hypothetical protein
MAIVNFISTLFITLLRKTYHAHRDIVGAFSRLHWQLTSPYNSTQAKTEHLHYQNEGYKIVHSFLTEDEVDKLKEILQSNPIVEASDFFKLAGWRSKLRALGLNTIFYRDSAYGMRDKLINYKYSKDAYKILCQDHKLWQKIVESAERWMNMHVCAEGVELYTTLASGSKHWNSNFHLDSYPKESFKMLIYLSDVDSKADGCTQIKISNDEVISLLGKRGSAVMFRAATVIHRGISPAKDRSCFCIAFGPSPFKSWVRPNPYLNGIWRRFSFLP